MIHIKRLNEIQSQLNDGNGHKYKVWSDSESKVYVSKTFNDIDAAQEFASSFVHRYDGKPFYVICHIEDEETDETIDTVENIPRGNNGYYLYKGYHEAYISDRPVAGTTNNRPSEYRTFNDAYEAAEKLGVDILYSDGLRDEVCDFFGDRNYCDENPELFFNPDEPIRESHRANARGRAINEWDETASLTSPKVIEQEDGDVTYSVIKFVEGGVRPHWEECKPITGSGTYNTKQQAIDSIRRERNVTTYRIIEKREVATVIFE